MEKHRFTDSIVFKSLFGIAVLLAAFSIIIGIIGYRAFSEAIMDQYADGAFNTAESASLLIDANKIDDIAESKGETEEYRKLWKEVDKLCNSHNATFVYVIQPDLSDYAHITFLISTMNRNSKYDLYEFGYVRETTNDEYKEKYRRLYEGESDRELVIRDRGYIETDPHITAMIPLKDRGENTKAILCVQRQMDKLVYVRHLYVRRVVIAMFLVMLVVMIGQWVYLGRVLLKPVREITLEARRFADENVPTGKKLTDTIDNRDEIGVLAGSIDDMEEQIQNYVDNLTEVTRERERIGTELELAKAIQREMLPCTFPAFPDYDAFSVYATMDPARKVGGDFYDFFLIDDDHLCLVIADVSGKGVPAALFMMATKIMISDIAKTGKSPAEVLESVNNSICANNKEKMFLTVWVGILEISTGKLTAANAGHEYPVLKFSGEDFELLKDAHSFIVGGMKNVIYKEYELDLSEGARLYIYTDGVPEATDSENRMFGTERMLTVLNDHKDEDPESVVRAMQKAVGEFVGEAERFDDMTMLMLDYKGTPEGINED